MYIQPCCIERELPALLRSSAYNFFQSNGDWTLQQLMKAVSLLVDPCEEATIVCASLDAFHLRTLSAYLAKSWYARLRLLTHDNQKESVKGLLSGYGDRVTYAIDKQVVDGLFALRGGGRFLIIQGPMLMENDFTLCQYSAYYGTNEEVYKQALEAIQPKLRLHKIEL